jgi:hypothetical protein
MLETTSPALNASNLDAFRQRLRELGYVEGRNLTIEYRSSDGHGERFTALAAELVALNVDLIVTSFDAGVTTKVYNTNYGDISLPVRNQSEFSRFTFSMDLRRDTHEAAIKLLTTMFIAPLVAFAAFLIEPTDVNTRFGVGVGALFAVATSAVIVASAVPDSSALTAADKMHMVAISFIFASLVQSAVFRDWKGALMTR